MSYIDQFIDVQNVGPGKVAIIKVAYNATIDKLHLFLSGSLTKADITQIEGKINGVTFFVDDATKMALRDAYMGVFTQTSTVTIDLTEPNIRGGAAAQYLAALPRNLMQSLTFEITIASGANAASAIKCMAEYRDPTVNPFILNRKKFTVALPATGENDLTLPVGADGGLIKRIWIHHGGYLTKSEVRTNGTPRSRVLDTELTFMQKREGLTPQTNIHVLDYIADGNLMGMLNTTNVTEVLMRLTVSQADQATIYVDYVSDLRKLK